MRVSMCKSSQTILLAVEDNTFLMSRSRYMFGSAEIQDEMDLDGVHSCTSTSGHSGFKAIGWENPGWELEMLE